MLARRHDDDPAAQRRATATPLHAWVVAAVTFVTLLAAAGIRSAPGVLIVPLEDEFGWSRSTISLAISINLLLFGLIGPFAAALMGRFGLRKVVVSALLLVAGGSLLTTQVTAAWQLVLLWGVVIGIGSGCMATVLAATVAARWFVARRGMVTGALTAATATGQLVFLPVLGWMAEEVGWQTVSVTVAIGALSVVPLVLAFLRNEPEDMGLTPYGAAPDYDRIAPIQHPIRTAFDGLRLAASNGVFWLLAGSFFVCGASTNGLIGTHFIPASHDHGMGEAHAAGLLALIGVFDVLGTIGSGWLTDRVDPRRLLFAYYGLRGLSLLVLDPALATGGGSLLLFMVFYGLDWVATVPPTVALVTEVFGRTRSGVVYGWVFAAHQVGAAASAWFAGASRGWTGSYRLSFMLAGALCLVAAAGTQRISRTPVGERPVVTIAGI